MWTILALLCARPVYAADEKALPVPSDETSKVDESPKSIQIGPMFDSRSVNADLEIGFTTWDDIVPPSRFFSRLRIGVLRARDPFFATLGVGLTFGGLRNVAIGVHGEITHYINGLSVHGFYAMALDRTSILGASVGWSVFGIEMDVAPAEDAERILLLKLRIPIGVIMYGASKMDRDVQKMYRKKKSIQ